MTRLPQSQGKMFAKEHWANLKRLAVHLVNDDRLNRDGYTLIVVFEPVDSTPDQGALTPLDAWKL